MQKGVNSRPKKLELVGFDFPFHPHGISFVEIEGQKLLFVINHRTFQNGEFVEIFEFKEEKL
jgi:hypothetical protein